MPSRSNDRSYTEWRSLLNKVIFETDTTAGKAFDIVLIACIILSVTTVILESVNSIRSQFGNTLYAVEWFFTTLFSIEYILRLFSAKRTAGYATSFFGIVDLLAVIPTYISLLIPGSQSLLNIRVLRLLRIFRVFKLTAYLSEAKVITNALRASRRKISVFLLSVVTIVVIIGSLMYIIEGEKNGFTDTPTGIYWAIVTLTTVGYGDLSPQTPLGKGLASLVMIMGYGILAVPTGIVTVEISRASRGSVSIRTCPACNTSGHDANALYCKFCGAPL